MIYEELYVIDNKQRLKLDLPSPTGIVLNFKSNLFGDLSRIESSTSYTIQLPATANNTRILDLPEDVRHKSGKTMHRLPAEYVRNGVPLFYDANLYILEITKDGYSCVLTWNTLTGLQNMKDDDIALNELRKRLPYNDELGEGFLPVYALWYANGGHNWDVSNLQIDPTTFQNTQKIQRPLYNCGYPLVKGDWGWRYHADTPYITAGNLYLTATEFGSADPSPVVPTKALLGMISDAYGIRFDLGHECTGALLPGAKGWDEKDAYITYGCVPLVGTELTDKQVEALASRVKGEKTSNYYEFDEPFEGYNGGYHIRTTYEYQSPIKTKSMGVDTEGELDGVIVLRPIDPSLTRLVLLMEVTSPDDSDSSVTKKEIFYVPCAGRRTDGYFVYDFRKERGRDRLKVAAKGVFNFYTNVELAEIKTFSVKEYYDTGDVKYFIDSISNLPGISCVEFIKSLFYLTASVPKINPDKSIGALYYSDIRDSIVEDRILDWSDKIIAPAMELPESLQYNINDNAQHNYYMMSSDNMDKTKAEKEKEDDWYADGIGDVRVHNDYLSREKTIYQSPWSAPYIHNKKTPDIDVGGTIKAWEYDEETHSLKRVEPKPAYGIVYAQPSTRYDGGGAMGVTDYEHTILAMRVLSPFKNMQGYDLLRMTFANPYILSEYMYLTELDLRDLDYSKPIYLDKYNALFGIISIELQDEISKVVLVKLPTADEILAYEAQKAEDEEDIDPTLPDIPNPDEGYDPDEDIPEDEDLPYTEFRVAIQLDLAAGTYAIYGATTVRYRIRFAFDLHPGADTYYAWIPEGADRWSSSAWGFTPNAFTDAEVIASYIENVEGTDNVIYDGVKYVPRIVYNDVERRSYIGY